MTSDPSAKPVLNIGLSLAQEGQPYIVEDIELQGGSMRHRISSTKSYRALHDVLCHELSDFIEHALKRLDGERVVYSDVDAQLQLRDLSLRGLQIQTSRRDCGVQRISVRFVEVEGNVQALLRDVVPRTQAETKAIAMEAIERVVGRTYDVARVLENVHGMAEPGSAFQGCTSEILKRRQELLFRLGLLQRAVADQYVQSQTETEIERLIASG